MHVQSETIASATADDSTAFGARLESCHNDLCGHVADRIGWMYRSAIPLEDVIQVTYIDAFLRMSDLLDCSMGRLLAWLKTAAENNLRDAIRALNASKRPSLRKRISGNFEDSAVMFLSDLVATDTTPTQGARRSEIAQRLEIELKNLPPDYERAIRLYDLEGRSMEEVISSLDRTTSAAGVYMLRARARDCLRTALGDPENFFSGSS